ncbi:MAG: 2OG-Fe(II) oxygenase [Pirellulaceae bacterium]|jgi:predicted 2-oxoglutarate/Fe(II)-dependent dioxygenase YbiX|nr:2OG-Fe(II) oxygenase [Pirellulaceae bacterium]
MEYHEIAPYLITVSNFLSPEECADLIELTEQLGYSDAPINGPAGPTIAKSIRNNDRVMVDDVDRANALWERARDVCPTYYQAHRVVGLNERFRFYRYRRGQVFRWHRDGSFRRANGDASRLTFLVYLNDGFAGGETLFEDAAIEPQQGKALIFAHGYLHEGGEVLDGEKYVMRTDVIYSAAITDD